MLIATHLQLWQLRRDIVNPTFKWNPIYRAREVLDAVTYFDFETRQIQTTVLLEGKASDSVLEDLNALAVKSLSDAIRPDILDILTVSVTRSESPVLGGDD